MQEQIKVYRENGELTALTYDSLGAQISLRLDAEDVQALTHIMDKALALRPKWELDVDKAREDAKLAQQATASAVEAKKSAELEREKAETKAQTAETKKVAAEQARDAAVARAVDLESQIKQANDKIAQLLTGGITDQATTELIMLYPELTEQDYGRSIDAGEAYRVGTILYIATRDINGLTADTMPTSTDASSYWRGGNIKHEDPTPTPGFKYPAGTELEYQGVMYYATKDTNSGPEAGYPEWDLLENKPKA
ncbi:MAG: hypothetical protein SPK23_01305 [Eubacteriales bacterium]|nr:hypothetical protein [Eubacteriales bacterium]